MAATTPSRPGHPLPEPDVARAMFTEMLRIRRFEERVHELTMAKELEGYTHTAYGEEATAVGAISLLRDGAVGRITFNNPERHNAMSR